jgi:protein-S-isoprenylcysteine O-methyltransferase Ste14
MLELVRQLLQTASLLIKKEVELARAELKADLQAQLLMAKRLAVAAVLALLGINLLLVAAVFALAHVMPGWLAALTLGVLLLVVGGAIGLAAWRRRVSAPLAVTRKHVKEDLEWAKEHLT